MDVRYKFQKEIFNKLKFFFVDLISDEYNDKFFVKIVLRCDIFTSNSDPEGLTEKIVKDISPILKKYGYQYESYDESFSSGSIILNFYQ